MCLMMDAEGCYLVRFCFSEQSIARCDSKQNRHRCVYRQTDLLQARPSFQRKHTLTSAFLFCLVVNSDGNGC